MAPIVLTLLQGLFLVLLYLFVWRIARAVLRDVRSSNPASQAAAQPQPQPRASTPELAPRPTRSDAPRAVPEPRDDRPSRGLPRELVIHRSGGRPLVLALGGREISFGRAAPATVVLDDPYVSDRHARVRQDGSEWVIDDLGSTNGTFLNSQRVTSPIPLAAGDQLGIGKTIVEVRR